jgi:hypothetical protein
MSLKSVLDAQKSGELDLIPGSAFNQPSPLTIENGVAYVMFGGDEWYYTEIDHNLILEALELVGISKSDVHILNSDIVDKRSGKILYSGEDLSDLLSELASVAGIYTERH